MDAEPFVSRILEDEGIRGDLDDDEATALNERLIALVTEAAATAKSAEQLWPKVTSLCQTARAIAKSVSAFRDGDPVQAQRIAAENKLAWPANPPESAGSLMSQFLSRITIG